jgi:hypothetical protein
MEVLDLAEPGRLVRPGVRHGDLVPFVEEMWHGRLTDRPRAADEQNAHGLT